MFNDERTLNNIHANLNDSVSRGTMRRQDLIPVFLTVLRDTPEYVQVMNVVPAHALEDEGAVWWSSDDAIMFFESLFETLDMYAPQGYYFGAHPGDGSDYGYWKLEN